MRQTLQSFAVEYRYPIIFSRRAFEPSDPVLREVLERDGQSEPRRLLAAVDSGLLRAWPRLIEEIRGWAEANAETVDLVGPPLVVRGGEICKSDPREVEELWTLAERHRLCRHSYVLAVGGGSVLDAVGYAVATAHRGLRLIRMPSTVLAQNDAGIGVKNGINFHGRKNFVGTFAPPFAVVNDLDLLSTLPARDLRSGIAEAIKVALIRDADFFGWLHASREALGAFENHAMEEMIARCADLHLRHVREGGDAFESGSARPLDFGHWSAHKLEELSDNQLRHGEAVAIGIAIDALYCARRGMIDPELLARILETLEEVGFDLHHPILARLDVGRALEDFREHLGGQLCITLLGGQGRGVEVSEIDRQEMKKCVETLLS